MQENRVVVSVQTDQVMVNDRIGQENQAMANDQTDQENRATDNDRIDQENQVMEIGQANLANRELDLRGTDRDMEDLLETDQVTEDHRVIDRDMAIRLTMGMDITIITTILITDGVDTGHGSGVVPSRSVQ